MPIPDNLPVIALPPALDGSHGSNRARGGVCQIAAKTDVDAVRLWLAEYADSPHTLRCYRKEAARLLLWAARVPGKPLSSLTREDLLAYEAFLAHPAVEWIDPSLPAAGRAAGSSRGRSRRTACARRWASSQDSSGISWRPVISPAIRSHCAVGAAE